MRKLRTFIAVELGSSVKGKAQQLLRKLQGTGVEANWVPLQQMHLTLKFLGEIPEHETVDVCRVVKSVAAEFEPFEITFRGAGAFPDVSKPKTLWIGLGDGLEELAELQDALEDRLHKQLRFPRERRKFTPHLTLGRVKSLGPEPERVAQLLEEAADYDSDLSVVEELVTFASFLDRSGPEYEAIAHAELGED